MRDRLPEPALALLVARGIEYADITQACPGRPSPQVLTNYIRGHRTPDPLFSRWLAGWLGASERDLWFPETLQAIRDRAKREGLTVDVEVTS